MKLNPIYLQFFRRIAPKGERDGRIIEVLEKEGYSIEFISAYIEMRDNALFILKDVLRKGRNHEKRNQN